MYHAVWNCKYHMCRGYYVDTAGKNRKKIAKYIRNQLEEDKVLDQVTMKEFADPFRGGK